MLNGWLGVSGFYNNRDGRNGCSVSKLQYLYATLLAEIASPDADPCHDEDNDNGEKDQENHSNQNYSSNNLGGSCDGDSSQSDSAGGVNSLERRQEDNVRHFRKMHHSILYESMQEMKIANNNNNTKNNRKDKRNHVKVEYEDVEMVCFDDHKKYNSNNTHGTAGKNQHNHHPGGMSWEQYSWRMLAAHSISSCSFLSFNYDDDYDKIELMVGRVNNSSGDETVETALTASLTQARHKEAKVVSLIQSIGKIVFASEQQRQQNTYYDEEEAAAIFEYFCDKNILSLLVEIAKAKPTDKTTNNNNETKNNHNSHDFQSKFNGVVWTSLVKSQVLQTISLLISNVQDPKSLFYLLSNNYVNDLVTSFVPLHQWSAGTSRSAASNDNTYHTTSSLEEIVPVYVSFLKTLTLQLARAPHLLFQFYIDETGMSSCPLPSFPLLYAAVQLVTSHFAQSDSFIHTTALSILLNLYQIIIPTKNSTSTSSNSQEQHYSVQIKKAITNSFMEQRYFVSHLNHLLLLQYKNIVSIMSHHISGGRPIGEVSEQQQLKRRADALSVAITSLQDQLHFINDLLWCNVKSTNVQFCENFLRWVLYSTIFPNILPHQHNGSHHQNTNETTKVISAIEKEAMQNSSILFLTQLFIVIDYVPLLRMLAVAILHPYTPAYSILEPVLHSNSNNNHDAYLLTKVLNAIAQNHVQLQQQQSKFSETTIHSNQHDDNNSSSDDTNGIIMNINSIDTFEQGEDEANQNESNNHDDLQTKSTKIDDDTQHKLAQVAVNPYRQQIISLLQGDMGYERFSSAAILLESILSTKTIDNIILRTLHVLPDFQGGAEATKTQGHNNISTSLMSGEEILVPSEFDNALAIFFETDFNSSSLDYILALECGLSLTIKFINHLLHCMTEGFTNFTTFSERFCSSSLVKALVTAKKLVAEKALKLRHQPGLDDLFSDLVEMEITRRCNTSMPSDSSSTVDDNYNKISSKEHRCNKSNNDQNSNAPDDDIIVNNLNDTNKFVFKITEHTMDALNGKTEFFIHKEKDNTATNDVEEAKFAIRMAISFNALCKQLVVCHDKLSNAANPLSLEGTRWANQDNNSFSSSWKVSNVSEIDNEMLEIGGFKDRHLVGNDLDVQGRTFFYFLPPTNMEERLRPRDFLESKNGAVSDKERKKNFTMRTKATSELMLVVDPTELFVVKPNFKKNIHRGTILCSAPLRCVIAIAPDNEWLHIAIRQVDDVDLLIKNGNMALRFDSVGTCLIVKQYLDKSKHDMKKKTMVHIDSLLERCNSEPFVCN